MQSNFINDVENKIGYKFSNKELLLRAFTHSTYANEHRDTQDYERLEFLGDAVLGYIIGLYLYETFPNYREGQLSKIRAGVVDRKTVSEVVSDMDIMKYVRVGAGNAEENVNHSVKTNCDIFEAIIGAIVIDCKDDLQEARKFILKYLVPKIGIGKNTDYKSQVWEICAKSGKKADITVIEHTLHDNLSHFVVALTIDGKEVMRGEGRNKTSAAQCACRKYLESK